MLSTVICEKGLRVYYFTIAFIVNQFFTVFMIKIIIKVFVLSVLVLCEK